MSADVCACGSRFHASCSASPAPIDDRSPTERAAAGLALDAALAGERAASARALNAEAWAVAAMERCAWLEDDLRGERDEVRDLTSMIRDMREEERERRMGDG